MLVAECPAGLNSARLLSIVDERGRYDVTHRQQQTSSSSLQCTTTFLYWLLAAVVHKSCCGGCDGREL